MERLFPLQIWYSNEKKFIKIIFEEFDKYFLKFD